MTWHRYPIVDLSESKLTAFMDDLILKGGRTPQAAYAETSDYAKAFTPAKNVTPLEKPLLFFKEVVVDQHNSSYRLPPSNVSGIERVYFVAIAEVQEFGGDGFAYYGFITNRLGDICIKSVAYDSEAFSKFSQSDNAKLADTVFAAFSECRADSVERNRNSVAYLKAKVSWATLRLEDYAFINEQCTTKAFS